MLFEKRFDAFLIQVYGALVAGKDEVEMTEETEPGVEGDPREDEVELMLG